MRKWPSTYLLFCASRGQKISPCYFALKNASVRHGMRIVPHTTTLFLGSLCGKGRNLFSTPEDHRKQKWRHEQALAPEAAAGGN